MGISDARRRANLKWSATHKEYFNEWAKNKYNSDPEYREKCKQNVKRYRELQKEIKAIMMTQYVV